jgi:hypothetical protein
MAGLESGRRRPIKRGRWPPWKLPSGRAIRDTHKKVGRFPSYASCNAIVCIVYAWPMQRKRSTRPPVVHRIAGANSLAFLQRVRDKNEQSKVEAA